MDTSALDSLAIACPQDHWLIHRQIPAARQNLSGRFGVLDGSGYPRPAICHLSFANIEGADGYDVPCRARPPHRGVKGGASVGEIVRSDPLEVTAILDRSPEELDGLDGWTQGIGDVLLGTGRRGGASQCEKQSA